MQYLVIFNDCLLKINDPDRAAVCLCSQREHRMARHTAMVVMHTLLRLFIQSCF